MWADERELLKRGGGVREESETQAGLADNPRRAPPRYTHLSPPWGAGIQARKRETCPVGLQLAALQMWAGEGRHRPDVGSFRSLGALLRPPPVSELGLVSEFGGWGGEEAAGTGEGDRNLLGFPSAPATKFALILGSDPP